MAFDLENFIIQIRNVSHAVASHTCIKCGNELGQQMRQPFTCATCGRQMFHHICGEHFSNIEERFKDSSSCELKTTTPSKVHTHFWCHNCECEIIVEGRVNYRVR